MFLISILLGKTVTFLSRLGNFGDGSTWPGHIALKLNPNFLKEIARKSKLKIVFVVGTNGKTTTSAMIATILRDSNKKVFQNTSGANLKNGIASAFIIRANMAGRISDEYAIFEVDENNLSLILKDITPHAIIILNLFRDQLDRYGELDSIASKWNIAFQSLTPMTGLFLNADDPLIADLGRNTKARVYFFGLNEETMSKTLEHAADSIYCPRCKTKLDYTRIYYSHLGHWQCPKCKFSRPEPELMEIFCPLPGTYNKYNALAAGLFSLKENISMASIEQTMKNMTAVFGRQEKIARDGKNIQIFLSKNPTSWNESLKAIFSESKSKPEFKAPNFLFALNDNIPDGRDISWIWDIDFEKYMDDFGNVTISGQRAYDMALRLEYAQEKYRVLGNNYHIEPDLQKAVTGALEKTPAGGTLYILPTYSAMLLIRKILTGKKIL